VLVATHNSLITLLRRRAAIVGDDGAAASVSVKRLFVVHGASSSDRMTESLSETSMPPHSGR